MKDRWNYAGLGQVQYGDEASYQAAADWLDWPGWIVEDWGCGCAFARRFFRHATYIGIDGSQNDYADICRVELDARFSKSDGLLMRHVLDHNEGWRAVLNRAASCCQRRMVIDLFIPFGPVTRIVDRTSPTEMRYPDIVNMQFRREDLMEELLEYSVRQINTSRDFLMLCEKKPVAKNQSGPTVTL